MCLDFTVQMFKLGQCLQGISPCPGKITETLIMVLGVFLRKSLDIFLLLFKEHFAGVRQKVLKFIFNAVLNQKRINSHEATPYFVSDQFLRPVNFVHEFH